MTSLAVPKFQTKSKRNLFVEDAEKPSPCSSPKSVEVTLSVDTEIKQSKTSESTGSTKKSMFSKISPRSAAGKLKRSPKKSPKSTKSPQSGGSSESYFWSFVGMFTGSGKKRRPLPVAKGVYFDFRTSDFPKESQRTLPIGVDGSEPESIPEWIASNLEDHQRNVPIVVRRPEHDSFNEEDDQKLLRKIIAKAKKLPQDPGKYASNHIMVNAVRTERNIPPLRRERYMDQIARDQAKLMAEEQTLFHIEHPRELQHRLKALDAETNILPDYNRLGTNIGKGKSIAEVHRFMMAALAERNNIRDKRFCAMGMGTSTDATGVVYMCQIYGG